MSMMLDYKKLFEPYTKDGHTLSNSIRYIKKTGQDRGVPSEIIDLAIQEIFTEIANGKEYPKDKCPCGCGINKAATSLIHAIRDRMLELDHKRTTAYHAMLNQRHNDAIIGHIAEQNKAYIEEKLKPHQLLDWSKSPVLKGIKWIFSQSQA